MRGLSRFFSVSFQPRRHARHVPLGGVRCGRQLGEDVRGEVRREEDLGEHPLGLLHEPCGVLLRHAQRSRPPAPR